MVCVSDCQSNFRRYTVNWSGKYCTPKKKMQDSTVTIRFLKLGINHKTPSVVEHHIHDQITKQILNHLFATLISA